MLLLALSLSLASCGLFEDEDHGDDFVAVTDISINSSAATAGSSRTLSGTVSPSGATNKTIVWSVFSDGDTGAEISGTTFSASAAGTAVVRATIANGTARGQAYTKNFDITVSAAGVFVPVESIAGVPGSGNVGNLSLAGTVNPENASNQDIVWTVASQGTTGAIISGTTLITTATGSVTVTATIANGTAV